MDNFASPISFFQMNTSAAIAEHLALNARFLSSDAIKEPVSPEMLRMEAEEGWRREIEVLQKKIADYDSVHRSQILSSKEQVFEAWKRECNVFLERLTEGGVLHRYNDEKEGVRGYVITSNAGTRYFLSF